MRPIFVPKSIIDRIREEIGFHTKTNLLKAIELKDWEWREFVNHLIDSGKITSTQAKTLTRGFVDGVEIIPENNEPHP